MFLQCALIQGMHVRLSCPQHEDMGLVGMKLCMESMPEGVYAIFRANGAAWLYGQDLADYEHWRFWTCRYTEASTRLCSI